MRALQCPKCSVPLGEFVTETQLRLDLCPECRGLWFDRGELGKACGVTIDLPDEVYSIQSMEPTEHRCATCTPQRTLVKMTYARGHALEVDYCKFCRGIFLDFQELSTIRAILRKRMSELVLDPVREKRFQSGLRVPYDSPKLNRLALPACIGLSLILQAIFATSWLMFFLFVVQIHEFGHTIVMFLGGIGAIPLSALVPMAGLTVSVSGQSTGVFWGVVSVLGLLGYLSMRARCRFPAVTCAVLILAAVKLRWFTSMEDLVALISYSGIGGEFVLSTFLIVAFYYRFPDRIRWDFFRFVFLLAGTATFLQVYWLWYKISRHQAEMPMGAMLYGRDHQGGDLNVLFQRGWTADQITHSYLRLGGICTAVILAHYLWNLRTTSRPSSSS